MSPEPDRLPPALTSMWRLCRLGYRHEPRLLLVALLVTFLAALPDVLVALWLALLTRAVVSSDDGLLLIACLGLGASAVATWFLRTVSERATRRFRDRITIALEGHVARLQATVGTLAHQERPEFLDRLAVLRNQVFVLDHMFASVFATAAWFLRLAVTVGLLASVHPVLALLVLCAVPPAVCSFWRPGRERRAEELAAQDNRLARHLFELTTSVPAGQEIRVGRLADRLAADRRAAWERGHALVWRARRATAAWQALAWAVFAAGYVGALVAATALGIGLSGLVLVLVAGSRLSAYVGGAVAEIGFLRGTWMDGSRRLAWLEDYAAASSDGARTPAPARLTRGIRFEGVGFRYPGTDVDVLNDVTLELAAGSVVAVVGENGAGKSTLVKLLAKFYLPDRGRITVDGVPLADLDQESWRSRLAGAFQDFFRYELAARRAVGVGDLARLDDESAVTAAVGRAGAGDVVAALPRGLDTQLGRSWPDGAEASFGQWQKLALARGLMREEPLLLVLDEPTAALDAETEHALFERYAAQARRPGTVTLLVSHRFSTVRMADLIVVLGAGGVAETGTHEELMAADGEYAALYRIQARGYR